MHAVARTFERFLLLFHVGLHVLGGSEFPLDGFSHFRQSLRLQSKRLNFFFFRLQVDLLLLVFRRHLLVVVYLNVVIAWKKGVVNMKIALVQESEEFLCYFFNYLTSDAFKQSDIFLYL